jgi:protein-disulfide isomerase
MTSKVQADLQEGSSYGVQGTPTSFVNGKPVEGAVPYEQLKAVVEEALKKQ